MSKFNLFGDVWTINFVDKIVVEDSESFLFGLSDPAEFVITVATLGPDGKKLPLQQIKRTIAHEFVHSALDSGAYGEEAANEALVDWLSKCILEVFELKQKHAPIL